ncbi:hypothetical protein [uncultured Gilliamella sp.]|uniref:hypothetical protein n=1 Tax=uncultured Gilliamella sp. TaxID=1193505 RepID=UPI0025F0BD77|nr:hypothetical protein [uncultured Gilliamella sp.]
MKKFKNSVLGKLTSRYQSLKDDYTEIYPVRMDFTYHEEAYQRRYGQDAYMDMRNLSDLTLLSGDILGIAWVMAYSE